MMHFHPLTIDERKRYNLFIAAYDNRKFSFAIEAALVLHFPQYETDSRLRTRISILVDSRDEINKFIFRYQELFDNSYWRVINLSKPDSTPELHRPQYESLRNDFVDVEWEFVIGQFEDPIVQSKIRSLAANPEYKLVVAVDDAVTASLLRRRLPSSAFVEIIDKEISNPFADHKVLAMAKRLHYFYLASVAQKAVPVELPEDEVDKAWNSLDESLRFSNLYSVLAIPVKMQMLGHECDNISSVYALTSKEIDMLTAVEHNRWSVERLIQSFRPCTDEERKEVESDLRSRTSSEEYANTHPVSLKKKYKTERTAHFDLCAYSELGVDETGLPVTRYDRDLTAAIPLIAQLKTNL